MDSSLGPIKRLNGQEHSKYTYKNVRGISNKLCLQLRGSGCSSTLHPVVDNSRPWLANAGPQTAWAWVAQKKLRHRRWILPMSVHLPGGTFQMWWWHLSSPGIILLSKGDTSKFRELKQLAPTEWRPKRSLCTERAKLWASYRVISQASVS